MLYVCILFCLFKQKTAYEMRISDWSSDVCSSDLLAIEIRHLRAAVVTADTRSFSRAAKLLHVKQSALSRRVQALEQMLGVQLFERTKRGTFATENGKAFLTRSEEHTSELQSLMRTSYAVFCLKKTKKINTSKRK